MTADQTPSQVRPFAAVLAELRRGEVLDQASRELQTLVRAVSELGKKGKLVVELTVEPMRGDATALNVTGAVKTTLPQQPAAAAIFFTDADSNLVRDDPRQAAIPGVLREIKQAANDTYKEIAK